MGRSLCQSAFVFCGLVFMAMAVLMLLTGEHERSGIRMVLAFQFWQMVFLEHLYHVSENKT